MKRKNWGDFAGGIVDFAYGFGNDNDDIFNREKGNGIINCRVNADIIATEIAGGIAGRSSPAMLYVNCTFTGSLKGLYTGKLYAFDKW